jgi:DNA-binding NtrC family response regulator
VDVRIIATTNRDLASFAAAGHFRQDLYFRLSVIPFRLPPLRERKEDIPLLATRFAMRISSDLGKEVQGISTDAMLMLQAYDWPGNVRELQHSIERAVILSPDPVLPPHAFDGARFGLAVGPSGPAAARLMISPATPSQAIASIPDGAVVLTSLNVNEAEARLIERALEVSKGNRTRAADLLGISVRTLRNKLNGPGREAAE